MVLSVIMVLKTTTRAVVVEAMMMVMMVMLMVLNVMMTSCRYAGSIDVQKPGKPAAQGYAWAAEMMRLALVLCAL